MKEKIRIKTKKRNQFLNITDQIKEMVGNSGIQSGICICYVPHTTAGITINESADPSVKSDIINTLNRLIPPRDDYSHSEGNADSHVKSSLIGCSERIPISDNSLSLGTWQGIFFCEFDGPRTRNLHIRILEST